MPDAEDEESIGSYSNKQPISVKKTRTTISINFPISSLDFSKFSSFYTHFLDTLCSSDFCDSLLCDLELIIFGMEVFSCMALIMDDRAPIAT